MAELELLALVCSRLCHDLVGPVGAVANGIEMAQDDGPAGRQSEALELAADSVAQAGGRLRFMRVALGANGGPGSSLPLADLAGLAQSHFAGGRVRLDWQASDGTLPRDRGRLLLLMVHLAGECLPRGGAVSVSLGGDGALLVTAAGDRAGPPSDLAAGLANGPALELAPRAAFARLIRDLSRANGWALEQQPGEGQFGFHLAP